MKTKSKFTRPFITAAAAIAVTLGTLTVAAPSASAFPFGPRFGHSHQRHVQVYKVRTIEVCRQNHFEWRQQRCGRSYKAWYSVITYRDIYSNGTSRTYKVTQWS
jgi:hypothetical protein